MHHDALVNTNKLYLVFHVVAQVYRVPDDRKFPGAFLNNLWRHLIDLRLWVQSKQKNKLARKTAQKWTQNVLPVSYQKVSSETFRNGQQQRDAQTLGVEERKCE